MNIEDEFLSEVNDGIKQRSKKRKASCNAKVKGNNNERECAKLLTEHFKSSNLLFRRNVQSGAVVGGLNAKKTNLYTDEQLQMLASDLSCNNPKFAFSIEHKAYKDISFWDLFNESSNLNSWLEQCLTDAGKVHKMPWLIIKINNHKRISFTPKEFSNNCCMKPKFTYNYNNLYFDCYWLEDLLNNTSDEFFLEN